MNKINYIGLFFFLFLISCGGGDDTPEPPVDKGITSISISSSVTTIEIGSSISFTVTGNNGSNITSNATIYINGTPIQGNSYSPQVVGNFTASARYNALQSNSLIIEAKQKPVTSIKIVSDNDWVNLENKFTFSVTDSNESDITENATIFVNSFEIEGNTFTPNSYGTYSVYAKYESFTSETIVLTSKEKPTNFTKKVLIEDFTGTWCGWCPRVSRGLEIVNNETNNAITVAIHRGQGSDPYHFGESNINQLDEGRYPTAKLNRTTIWEGPEPTNKAQVLNLIKDNTDLGLSIKSELTSSAIEIKVNVGFLTDFSEVKLVVYLLEDKLYYNQVNYTQYYGGADVLIDFEHNNVLRKVVTDLFGDPIPSNNSEANMEYMKEFSIPVPGSVSNPDYMSVVAFVLDASGTALNVQRVAINSYKNYD